MLRIGPSGELVSICFEPESGGKYVCTCYKPQTTTCQYTLQLHPSQSVVLDAIVVHNHVLVVLSKNNIDRKVYLARFNLKAGNLLLEPLMICEYQETTEPSGRVYYRRNSETIDVGLFTPPNGPITLFRIKDDSLLEVQGHRWLSVLAQVGWLTCTQVGLVFAYSEVESLSKSTGTIIRCAAIKANETQLCLNGLDYWFNSLDNVNRMDFKEGGRAALVLFNSGMIQILTQSPGNQMDDKISNKPTIVEMELYLPQNVSIDQVTKLVLAWTCNGYRPIVLLTNGVCFAVSSRSSNKGFVQFTQDTLDVQCQDVFGAGSFTQFHILHRDGSIQVFDENLRSLCHLKSPAEMLCLPESKFKDESTGLKTAKEAIIKRIAMIEQEKAHRKRVKRDQLVIVESLEKFAVGNTSIYEFPYENVPLMNEKTGLPYAPSIQPNINEDCDDLVPKCDLFNCWFHGPSSLVVVECKVTCQDNRDKPTAVHLSLSKGKAQRGNFTRLGGNENHFISWAELIPSTSSTPLQLVILTEIVRGRNLAISSHVVHVLRVPLQVVLASQWVKILREEEFFSMDSTIPPPGYVVDRTATRLVNQCDWESMRANNNAVISAFANLQPREASKDASKPELERVSISALGDTRLSAMLQVLASNSHGMYKCYDEEIELVNKIKNSLENEKDAGEYCRMAQTIATDELVSQLIIRLHKDADTKI